MLPYICFCPAAFECVTTPCDLNKRSEHEEYVKLLLSPLIDDTLYSDCVSAFPVYSSPLIDACLITVGAPGTSIGGSKTKLFGGVTCCVKNWTSSVSLL